MALAILPVFIAIVSLDSLFLLPVLFPLSYEKESVSDRVVIESLIIVMDS